MRTPSDARRLDLSGKFVMPGMFDMHAHSTLNPSPETYLARRVAEGVLSIRDMGASFESIPNLSRPPSPDGPPRPRIWFTGPIMDGTRVGGEAFRIFVDEPTAVRAAVERLKAAHVQFIKVHDWLRADVYAEVTRAARAADLPVVGHIPASVTAETLIESGQRSIEHMGSTTHGVLRSCSTTTVASPDTLRTAVGEEINAYAAAMSDAYLTPLLDGFNPDRCRVLIGRLAKAKVWQVPTLSWWQWVADEPPRVWKGPIPRLLTILLRITGMMAEAGVPVMTGLDGARAKTLPDELELLVRAGLSPAGALRAASLAPAEFLGARDSLGAIKVNYLADLIVLEDNPLDDVRNTRHIFAVVMNGRFIPKSEFSKF